jgi:hypothetical protein
MRFDPQDMPGAYGEEQNLLPLSGMKSGSTPRPARSRATIPTEPVLPLTYVKTLTASIEQTQYSETKYCSLVRDLVYNLRPYKLLTLEDSLIWEPKIVEWQWEISFLQNLFLHIERNNSRRRMSDVTMDGGARLIISQT